MSRSRKKRPPKASCEPWVLPPSFLVAPLHKLAHFFFAVHDREEGDAYQINQHRHATHTTMPPPPRPLDGLVWPLVPNSKKEGDRSTTWANKQALAAAISAVDPALAERVLGERQWRQKYTKYVYKHVEACLQSKEAAVASSKAGLEWVHSNFEFIRGGKSMTLADAMKSITGSFETGFLKGSKPRPTETVLEVRVDE